jgi:hypothetical protein
VSVRPCPRCGSAAVRVYRYEYGSRVVCTAYCPAPCSTTYSTPDPEPRAACIAPGCTTPTRRGSLVCPRHRPCPRPADRPRLPGYELWHRYLRALRGPASAHACADCGGRAASWAYDGRPSPLVATRHRSRYALDPAAYRPLCHACHARDDRWHEDTPRDASGRFSRTPGGVDAPATAQPGPHRPP